MSKTIGAWTNLRSHACFIYVEHDLAETPDACHALLERVVDGLGVGPDDLKISTKDYFLQWSKFAWKKVDGALEKGLLAITLMVGTPAEVHLAARIQLRIDPTFRRKSNTPPTIWLAAEATRWPGERFVPVARSWLRIAAEQCRPLSGGVLAAAHLRDAKVEAGREYETMADEVPDAFTTQIEKEPAGLYAWEKLRRIYPITLLGPPFANRTSPAQLREAGAVAVEPVRDSLIVDATPDVVEAWSPAYLEATKDLRRLVWPWSFQHPMDDPNRRRPKSQRTSR